MLRLTTLVSDRIIRFGFYLLFFFIPLLLTPYNYELFEYNKMMGTYIFTIIIVGSWIVKMISERKFIFRRTPLDVPLLLFFLSQVVATVFSIDVHTSIWGYYSRFNGGLLSTISYILLYLAFVSNFQKRNIKILMTSFLSSAVFVALYAVLEHLGIDRELWVQDVQNRVFSTLGQPNWLAAYLDILIPITIVLGINTLTGVAKTNPSIISYLFYLFLTALFTISLLFTKSRSGLIGFFIIMTVLSVILIVQKNPTVKKGIGIILALLAILLFTIGTPFEKLERVTLSHIRSQQQPQSTKPVETSGETAIIDIGITGSDTIRRIVWKGAVDIFVHHPWIGTGVETFAQSYYAYRPVEHNMTSEWDFLYNKAHNEYLNFAANTGIFGLGTYVVFILVVFFSFAKFIQRETPLTNLTPHELLILGIASGWSSILITNFFGFSVVIVQLFFFLLPALLFGINQEESPSRREVQPRGVKNTFFIFGALTGSLTLVFVVAKLWYADVLFARGYHLSRSQQYFEAYKYLKNAITLNSGEPFYYDEIAYPTSQLAVVLTDDKNASAAAVFAHEAIAASDVALSLSPQNVNYWKTRTRVMYALTAVDDTYLDFAIQSLEQARSLAPTDPKITYNLGLLYDQNGKTDEAIAMLTKTTQLKPDYRDAYYALSIFYEKNKEIAKARASLEFILNHIATDDGEATKKLEELK